MPPASDRFLKLFLRATGLVMLLAALAVCMPTDWMAAIHQRLGFGALPRAPIVEYLTRSVSALYALFGVLTLYVTIDLPRHLPVIRVSAILGIVFGLAMLLIDFTAPMPLGWALGEGPVVIALSAVTLWLARK